MGRMLLLTALCLLARSAAQDIILFGDSLSDNGGGYAQNAKFVLRTNDTYPGAPYYAGRWTNGPTWIEVAAQQLGVNLFDYGAAGATTGAAPAQVPPLYPPFGGLTVPTTVLSPTLFQQLNSHFLVRNNTLSSQSIYFILIGGNDFFSTLFQGTNVTADLVIANYMDAIEQLYIRGARRFVLVGSPDVSVLPAFTQHSIYGYYSNASVTLLSTLIANLDTQLQSLVSSFPSQFSGASATYFDWGNALVQLVENAGAYGLTNLEQACYVIAPNLTENATPTSQPIGASGGQLCSDPDSYLFWDQFHPSRVAHEFVGGYFVQALGVKLFGRNAALPTVPSPSGSLPYLSISGK